MAERLGYSGGQKALHWIIAILVIGMVPGGIIMSEDANKPAFEAIFGVGSHSVLYDTHKAVGVIIVLLMLLRVLVKLMRPAPAYSPPLSRLQSALSASVHGLLYLLLILVPLLGWIGVSAYPAPLPFFGIAEVPKIWGPDRPLSEFVLAWHGPLALLIGGLALLHIAAALYHGVIRRDGVLSRMTR